MGYQYKGTNPHIEEEEAPKKRTKPIGQFRDDACGTYAGYRRHQKYKVPACRECKDAQNAYTRDYLERCGGRPRLASRDFVPGACGTYAGYARHLRSNVPPCKECHTAWLEYRREWHAKKRAEMAA